MSNRKTIPRDNGIELRGSLETKDTILEGKDKVKPI